MMGGKPWKPDKKCPFFSADLFQALEANSGGSEGCSAPLLGVTSYGVSMTTLEEVFLQLEDTNEETEGETDEFQSFEVQYKHSGILFAIFFSLVSACCLKVIPPRNQHFMNIESASCYQQSLIIRNFVDNGYALL